MTTTVIDRKTKPKIAIVNAPPVNNTHYKQHIVIVEDEKVCITALELILSSYNLTTFTNAVEALSYVRKHWQAIDLILSDNMLPGGMSGLELISIVKKDENLKCIPIILQSAMYDDSTKSILLLADGYIRKPYSRDKVLNAVRRTLDF